MACVVSTAKVQKIWEQFTTPNLPGTPQSELFRLQKYKKFESNSQHGRQSSLSVRVVSTAKVQKIWEQFTTKRRFWQRRWRCFDCKSTKNLRAIHNNQASHQLSKIVVSTAKVQKIWEQFTTIVILMLAMPKLFRLQKYKKFESNSQHCTSRGLTHACCFDCKSTKNLRAIHNKRTQDKISYWVVSTAKVQKIWEQFTTSPTWMWSLCSLFRLQKYKKFESNSQLHVLW